jgi:outer membrane protein assembly factor BamE (lipoprotein component of BamABCDE complex)
VLIVAPLDVGRMPRMGDRSMLPYLLAALSLLMSGCALEGAHLAPQEAQNKMTGMNKEQVLICMGPPAAKIAEGHTEVWSYTSSYSTGSDHPTVVLLTSGTAVSATQHCTVNVVMTDNQVSQVSYYGPTGALLTAGERCAYAIQNCIR